MKDRSKNYIAWTFNVVDARNALRPIGARNLTVIEAVIKEPYGYEVIGTYSKMVEHNYDEANDKAIKWMDETKRNNNTEGRYIYFRFVRLK